VLLCALDGDVFPRAAPPGGPQPAKDAHLARLLPAALAWAWPPADALARAAVEDEGELLDACRCARARRRAEVVKHRMPCRGMCPATHTGRGLACARSAQDSVSCRPRAGGVALTCAPASCRGSVALGR